MDALSLPHTHAHTLLRASMIADVVSVFRSFCSFLNSNCSETDLPTEQIDTTQIQWALLSKWKTMKLMVEQNELHFFLFLLLEKASSTSTRQWSVGISNITGYQHKWLCVCALEKNNVFSRFLFQTILLFKLFFSLFASTFSLSFNAIRSLVQR